MSHQEALILSKDASLSLGQEKPQHEITNGNGNSNGHENNKVTASGSEQTVLNPENPNTTVVPTETVTDKILPKEHNDHSDTLSNGKDNNHDSVSLLEKVNGDLSTPQKDNGIHVKLIEKAKPETSIATTAHIDQEIGREEATPAITKEKVTPTITKEKAVSTKRKHGEQQQDQTTDNANGDVISEKEDRPIKKAKIENTA